MNIFESLVVLNIENHTVELTGLAFTVELTGLAYSQEFHNIFALSCREPKEVSRNDTKFRDRT